MGRVDEFWEAGQNEGDLEGAPAAALGIGRGCWVSPVWSVDPLLVLDQITWLKP